MDVPALLLNIGATFWTIAFVLNSLRWEDRQAFIECRSATKESVLVLIGGLMVLWAVWQ